MHLLYWRIHPSDGMDLIGAVNWDRCDTTGHEKLTDILSLRGYRELLQPLDLFDIPPDLRFCF